MTERMPECVSKRTLRSPDLICVLYFCHRITYYNLNIIHQCLLSVFLDRKKAQRCLQRSPQITRFDRCSLLLSSHYILQPQHHKSMSPFGVLGQKESPDASPKEPSDRKIILGFFDFAKSAHFIRPTHKSTSPLGVLGHQENLKMAPRCVHRSP